MSLITVGHSVPNFEALATSNKTITLSNYSGKFIVLYFYPKDNTPACTVEAQGFRDNIDKFTELNAVILGVSRDKPDSHETFKAKQLLPFDLLSDKDEQLCTLFDVIKMKNMYGKQVRGIVRSTFLIDPHGLLVREWRKIKVKSHIEEVLLALNELNMTYRDD